ncbi:DsbA family protein [Bradyrhizobium sp. STM 3809]|uniref:DsbA family protein n=1 Tax=Bradyrhizobium sp. STM 3809 TaxID=551936 RepID=UPI000240656A|nr:DsbA family protein [Bradyrhizobium sp. STM 3809]CCD98198.1 putative disulfide bond formation protein D precursor (Disulfide oxidoreductase D) [Bradyrhizobium sp. STM 3809]
MTRKTFAASLATLMLLSAAMLPLQACAEDDDGDILSEARILRDPAIPVLGNADGDITIVEYFDYQCPYCRKISPELAKVVRDDGHVRLIFKDWPIFGGPSIYAARMTLAAKYQDKFAEAHEALISLKDKLSEANADAALSAAGIDLAHAKADLAAKDSEIDAILARNHEQAMGLGFQGTPAFIIGRFRVPGAPNAQAFKQAIADARKAARK